LIVRCLRYWIPTLAWSCEILNRPGTGRGGVSMAGGREGQVARKENGVRGHRFPSPPCLVWNLLMYFCFDEEGCWRTCVLCTHIREFSYFSHLFHSISFCLFSCKTHIYYFEFICLTLSLADTHGIARWWVSQGCCFF